MNVEPNAKPNEWNLVFILDVNIFDLVHVEDLGKIKLKFIILFQASTKYDVLCKMVNELNRLTFIEEYAFKLVEEGVNVLSRI